MAIRKPKGIVEGVKEMLENEEYREENAKEISAKEYITQLKAKARLSFNEKILVTISSNDPHETQHGTTFLSCANAAGGSGTSVSKYVPLGVKVELERCLVNTAKEATIPVFRSIEAPNKEGTGNIINAQQLTHKYTVIEH